MSFPDEEQQVVAVDSLLFLEKKMAHKQICPICRSLKYYEARFWNISKSYIPSNYIEPLIYLTNWNIWAKSSKHLYYIKNAASSVVLFCD